MQALPKGILTGLLFVLSGLPLIVYPAVLMASVMSLAGGVSDNEPILLMVVVYSFLIGSLAYPLVYLTSLIGFFVAKDAQKKRLFMRLPFLYIGLCIVLLIIWMLLG